MNAATALVAGCGDVGGRLARLLQAQGHAVLALNRSGRNVPAGVQWYRGDLGLPATLQGLPPCGLVAFLPTPAQRTEAAYRGVYVQGLTNLLDALPQPPGRLAYVSSTSVHGGHGGEWVDERTPACPAAFNGEVLLAGERLAAARVPGTVVVRLAGLYGPGRMRLRERALGGETGTARWTNRIHVEDAAAAIAHVLALPQPQSCYLAADDTPAREHTVLAWLRGAPDPGSPADQAVRDQGRRVCNRLLRASGWVPRYPDFRSGYAGQDARA